MVPIDIGAKPNDNLLNNWYFANPIDQRCGYVVPPGVNYYGADLTIVAGITTSYLKARIYNAIPTWAFIYIDDIPYYVHLSDCIRGYIGNNYMIDRWRTWHGDAVMILRDDGLTCNFPLFQILETDTLIGESLTISALTSDGILKTGTFTLSSETSEGGFWDGTCQLWYQKEYNQAVIYVADKIVVAAKLEYGTHQTLARQDKNGNWVLCDTPPDKALEILKCQRYCMVYGAEPRQGQTFMPYGTYRAGNSYFDFVFPCPNFRAVPMIESWAGFSLFDGQSVYGIKTMSVVGYSAGMVHIGVSPADGSRAFSNGEQAALFSEREKFVLSADL